MSSGLLAISLCLFSAITVAATNLFVKRGGDVLSTRAVVSWTMALSVVPLAPFVPMPTPTLWAALGVSIAMHCFYQFSMIRALHRGDLSLVFPVMRGLAPLLIAGLGTVFLNESPSLMGWIGLVLASLSLIVFAMPNRLSADLLRLQRIALIWAVITALGVAAYSVADARGTRLAENVLTFVVWLFLLDWIGVTLGLLFARKGQALEHIKPRLKDGVIGGLLGSLSYGSALLAFTLTDAANVAAIRETSVIFGAVFGAVFLKESFGPRRVTAAACLAFGLLLLEFSP